MNCEKTFEKKITNSHNVVAIAILCGFNEQDIIVSTICNALKQGFHVYYIDDFSTDDTQKLVEQFFCDDDRVGYCLMNLTYRVNDGSDKSWNLQRQLEYKSLLARTLFSNYKWLIHMDCDEVFECPWSSTVVDGLCSLPDDVGKVNCVVFDYFPSNNDTEIWQYDASTKKPMMDITSVLTIFRKRNEMLTYYRFLRISDKLNLNLGHNAVTHPDVVHSQKIIMHHFPYRSKELAKAKVENDRLPRISVTDKQSGIGWHYKLVNQLQLPIDVVTENQNITVDDGRYVTYYLKQEKPVITNK